MPETGRQAADPVLASMPETGLAACSALTNHPGFLDSLEADNLFSTLQAHHPWPANHYEVFGRRFNLPRLQTWHADPGIVYSYSNNLLVSQPWTPLLMQLRQRVEAATGSPFNAVLVNYYRDGNDFVGWHSDDEKEMGELPVIASLSLGAAREFCFRRRDNPAQRDSMLLQPGSLLVMAPAFQHEWEHSVPMMEACAGRINLTFRFVFPPAV